MNQHERHKAIIELQQDDPAAEREREKYLKSLNDPDNIAAFERNKKMITDENMDREEKIDIFDDTVLDNDTNVTEYILNLVEWINESHKKFIDKGIIIRINLKPREIKLVSNIYYRIVELYPELSNELGKRYTIYTALYYYLSTHIDALSSAIKVLRRIFGRLVEYAYYNVMDKSKKREMYILMTSKSKFEVFREWFIETRGPLMNELLVLLSTSSDFSNIRTQTLQIKGGKKQTKKRKPTKRRKTSKNRK